MKRAFVARAFATAAALSLGLALTACGTTSSPAATAPVAKAGTSVFDAKAATRYTFGASTGNHSTFDPRKPGDFAVFRVSGSFQNEPSTVTQRIAAREGSTLVMDYEIVKASGARESLRIGMDLVAARADTVFGVARVAAEKDDRKSLETLMSKTLVSMEIFEEVYRTPSIACEVAGKKIDCETATYRVLLMSGMVGAREGTLTVTTSDEFPWGSLDAEVITDDFDIVYRRELAEIGQSDPSKPIFVATNDLDLY